jgi:hypothetical protein
MLNTLAMVSVYTTARTRRVILGVPRCYSDARWSFVLLCDAAASISSVCTLARAAVAHPWRGQQQVWRLQETVGLQGDSPNGVVLGALLRDSAAHLLTVSVQLTIFER